MIDIKFDVYSDTPKNADPDQKSATLRRYHARLWSKPLPDGRFFKLSTETPGAYLHHSSELGEFVLTSDAISNTYRHSKLLTNVVSQVPEGELSSFFAQCSTIGAYSVFPGRTVTRRPTINAARGLNPQVGDRFDLTLECIRRHYAGGASPLGDVLARYNDFFELFGSFEGYVEFFFLQDLVSTENRSINFFLPHVVFGPSPYPKDLETYRAYRKAVMGFVISRNARIVAATR